MRRRNPLGDIWVLFLLFFFFGVFDSVIPLLVIFGVVAWLVYKAVKSSRTNEYTKDVPFTRNTNTNRTRRYGYADRTHSAADKARVNAYLRNRFRSGEQAVSLTSSGHHIVLTCNGAFQNLDALQISCDGHVFDTVAQFRKGTPGQSGYPNIFNNLFDTLLSMSKDETSYSGPDVVDVEFERKSSQPSRTSANTKSQPRPAAPQRPKDPSNAEEFRDVINGLNSNIPDEEITNSLYETSALLKQLSDLEKTFPDQKDKLKKLYTVYLPYLVKILKQYERIQHVETDPKFRENEAALKDTIASINTAMKTRLIPSMSETDSSNLSADMSTLEAMLRKDGMSDEGDIMAVLKKQQREEEKEGH